MSNIVGSFLVIALAVAGMAVGVLFGRAPIRGSCGGIAGRACAACTGKCVRENGNSDDDASNREENAC